MHEGPFFKKTTSADPFAEVSGRCRYGMVNRMIELTDWRRHELNRMIKFAGVNLQTLFACRTIPRCEQACLHDSVQEFALRGGPYIGLALRVQHGFDRTYSRSDCGRMIKDFAKQPFTEDAKRAAVGCIPGTDPETKTFPGCWVLQIKKIIPTQTWHRGLWMRRVFRANSRRQQQLQGFADFPQDLTSRASNLWLEQTQASIGLHGAYTLTHKWSSQGT